MDGRARLARQPGLGLHWGMPAAVRIPRPESRPSCGPHATASPVPEGRTGPGGPGGVLDGLLHHLLHSRAVARLTRAHTQHLLVRHSVRPVPGLRPGATLRVAQLSDVHSATAQLDVAVDRAVRVLAEWRPDLVVHTGDLWHHPDGIPGAGRVLRAARGTAATLAVPGNWEYRASGSREAVAAVYADAAVPLLVNARQEVVTAAGRVQVSGLDDWREGRPDAAMLPDRAHPGELGLLLLHEPGYLDHVPPVRLAGIDLALAGHTHGGQIRVPGLPALVRPQGSGRYTAGWYPHAPVPLYVNAGLGQVVPVRVGVRPELALFELVGQRDAGGE